MSDLYKPHRFAGLLWITAIFSIANAAYYSDNGWAVLICCVAIVFLAVVGIVKLTRQN